MAIRYRYEPIQAIGRMAYLTGAAARAEEEKRRYLQTAYQFAYQQRAFQNQMELAKFHADLNAERERQAFQWDLQKMAIRSANDFALEEERRKARYLMQLREELKREQEFRQAARLIIEDDTADEQEKKKALRNLQLKKLGFSGVYPRTPSPSPSMRVWQMASQLMSGQPAMTPTEAVQKPQALPAAGATAPVSAPVSREEFIAETKRLAKTNIGLAQMYYNTYRGMFE